MLRRLLPVHLRLLLHRRLFPILLHVMLLCTRQQGRGKAMLDVICVVEVRHRCLARPRPQQVQPLGPLHVGVGGVRPQRILVPQPWPLVPQVHGSRRGVEVEPGPEGRFRMHERTRPGPLRYEHLDFPLEHRVLGFGVGGGPHGSAQLLLERRQLRSAAERASGFGRVGLARPLARGYEQPSPRAPRGVQVRLLRDVRPVDQR
mmetsp:Transcript_83879/g.234073  ORF Transcript_83879/g.234073 Transcript_83879/m.234073 type:complete len:203 (-) Transcript_83879:877-1485(-)